MKDQKKFGLIGAAGYIAPRHMKAIKETGNCLVAALDKSDSVGIIDSYFPKSHFFTEFERFDRHVYKLFREDTSLDYMCICSPNYLHDSHTRFALRSGVNAIVEKPLVINPWNLDALSAFEEENHKRIYNILQLRLHPSVKSLKKRVEDSVDKIYDIDLSYITSRGRWYQRSWKANDEKSGGIITNIGVHFFDMLIWIFGKVQKMSLHALNAKYASGFLQLEKANVRWFLSIDENYLPESAKEEGLRTYRSLKIGEEEFEFSGGFTDLHTLSFQDILSGKGFGVEHARQSIETVYSLRNTSLSALSSDYHPFLNTMDK